jgi:hypothetical protein
MAAMVFFQEIRDKFTSKTSRDRSNRIVLKDLKEDLNGEFSMIDGKLSEWKHIGNDFIMRVKRNPH